MNINKKSIGTNLAAVSGKNVKIDPEFHYDNWARKYENELLNEYGYCAHIIASEALLKHETRKDCEIIDIGCGTGLVGEELKSSGFLNIWGLDVSSKMIAIAKKKQIYREFYQKKIENLEGIISKPFEALICVGSFGLGHIGPESLELLVKLVEKNSLIIIFMNAEPFNLENYMDYIEDFKKRNLVNIVDIQDHNYMTKLDRPGKLLIFRRN